MLLIRTAIILARAEYDQLRPARMEHVAPGSLGHKIKGKSDE